MEHTKAPYDDWHESRSREEQSEVANLRPWHLTVARRLPDLSRKKVIEIGCGRGDFALWLAKKYPSAEITGVDFSDKAIEIAQQRAQSAGSPVVFRVEDAQSLSLPSKEFDVVISCECLEHVMDPPAMAREIRRVLKPDGWFILTTPNLFNGMVLAWIWAWLRREPYNSGGGVQPHENFFLYWRVKRLLEKAGLKVRYMESSHFQWLLLPGFSPKTFRVDDFNSRRLKRLFRPFGLHFTFEGVNADARV